ncbi:hypothetical protein D3C84_1191330 [compost metagenome]
MRVANTLLVVGHSLSHLVRVPGNAILVHRKGSRTANMEAEVDPLRKVLDRPGLVLELDE